MISGAFGKVQLAHRLANEANADQAAGNVVMANRKMIQAHGLMVRRLLGIASSAFSIVTRALRVVLRT